MAYENKVAKDHDEIIRQVSKELFAEAKGINQNEVNTSSSEYIEFCKRNIQAIESMAFKRFCKKHTDIIEGRINNYGRTKGTDR